jgi:hypothetical protein
MMMTGVLGEDRHASRDDVPRRALAAAMDHDSAVLVEKQLHRWTNEGGAVLPND